MKLDRSIRHPNFIIGMISYVLLLAGIVVHASGMEAGKGLVVSSFILGLLHWVRSGVDVFKDPVLKRLDQMRLFWMSLVIMIPPLAGMIYYMTGETDLQE